MGRNDFKAFSYMNEDSGYVINNLKLTRVPLVKRIKFHDENQ